MNRDLPEEGDLVQGFTGAHHDSRKRVIRHHHRQAGFFAQQDIQISQQ